MSTEKRHPLPRTLRELKELIEEHRPHPGLVRLRTRMPFVRSRGTSLVMATADGNRAEPPNDEALPWSGRWSEFKQMVEDARGRGYDCLIVYGGYDAAEDLLGLSDGTYEPDVEEGEWDFVVDISRGLTDRQRRWLENGVYGSVIDSRRMDRMSFDNVARAAANWAADEWERRTKALKRGEFNPDWGDPSTRVSWSDVHAQLEEAGALENPQVRRAVEPLGGELRKQFDNYMKVVFQFFKRNPR